MLLAWAQGQGHRGIRRRCGQKKVEYVVAQCRPGMRLIAMVFGPPTPDTQTQGCLFSHSISIACIDSKTCNQFFGRDVGSAAAPSPTTERPMRPSSGLRVRG